MQAQTTFVFGHTHKPFSVSMKLDHFRDPLSVYNSGGWVVDTAETELAHGGAIVLADEELNVVSVRMYNEAEKQRRPTVKVEAVDGSENPLYEHVSRLVRCDQDPWLSFSRVVAENIDIYHKRFRDRLGTSWFDYFARSRKLQPIELDPADSRFASKRGKKTHTFIDR